MTKDKYGMFGKKRVKVPRRASNPEDPPPLRLIKPKHIEQAVYPHKISKLEPPEDPRPEVSGPTVRPQLVGNYLAPVLPRIAPEPVRLVPSIPPVKKVVAASTKSFFDAVKPLVPTLKVPETVLKEVPVVPGSREAKLRAFISKYF
jgi:hypothetical protein